MTLDEMMGRYWPGWSIVRQLGKGSYGAVYEVVRTDFTMEVKSAIKVITIPDSDSEVESLIADGMTLEETRSYYSDIVKDFISEIQLMETFRGTQNIVSIEDYQVVEDQDRIGWTVMIRMELLTTLNSFVAGADVTEADILKLGIDMCSALEMCARKNVIHRDIKPENIFVNPFGDYKLGDFGVARQLENVTGALSQKGTYNYMAPEIDRGDKYDSTVDIYSLGLVLYRFMNRRLLPFLTQENSMSPNARVEAVRRRLNGEPLPPPCMASQSFAHIILKACAYHPAERYQSAKEMKEDLNAVQNECDKGKWTVNEETSVQVKTESETMDRTVSVRHAQTAEHTHQGMESDISEQPLVRQTPISSSIP